MEASLSRQLPGGMDKVMAGKPACQGWTLIIDRRWANAL